MKEDELILKEVMTPAPGLGEVLVRIVATGFNPIDYQMRRGKSERKKMHSPILGREFSGIVIKNGPQAAKFQPGSPVFAAAGSMGSNGTYAEFIVVPEVILAGKPDNLSFEEAAGVPVAYLTALQIMNRGDLSLEKSIFITGAAGSVGQALIKLLLAKGFTNIIATAGSAESRQALINCCLPEITIVDYRSEAVKVGRLFDYCIDIVGGAMSELCADLLGVNGTYIDITALNTSYARELLFDKGARIINISNYAYATSGNTAYYGQYLKMLAELMRTGRLTAPPVYIIDGLSVKTVEEAHRLLENNQSKGQKLVMRISWELSPEE
ncbi:quinone oxidoreductase family protein [Mucilaginibacter oryzae]|uniref:quinone oxidoreductase family protein n=1 Tax=Mucilaginibacter oryzae TaxID=468058 RepID=UPI001473214C|nr:NADP-dependent oxidoreductase [Mucilaginibacter oryzae]